MKPVTVGRYSEASQAEMKTLPTGDAPPLAGGHAWLGWVETTDWIVWERDDGLLFVANGRDGDGAVRGGTVALSRAE